MMNTRKYLILILITATCALTFASHAFAQETPFAIENMPNVVGIGAGIFPDYEGSNNYKAGAAPFFKLTYPKTQWYAQLIATELYVNILNHPFLRFGPVGNLRFGRNDTFKVDDILVKKMSEIDNTWEAGAFAGVEFIDNDNPRNRFSATYTFLSDVGNVYKGYNMSLNARYWHQVLEMMDVTLGVGATYADDNFMDTYFSVSESDSEKTGLSVFKAGSGFKDVNVSPAVVIHLSRDWHVGVGMLYKRLLGDAKDSPLTKTVGSPDQFLIGLGVAYSWTW
jgi:outer membrane protein